MALRPQEWSLARQLFALQIAVVTVVVAAGLGAAVVQAEHSTEENAATRALAIARGVAATPDVRAALSLPDPTSVLQADAEAVRRATGTDFVVVMNTDGIRYSHPDTTQIGGKFLGHIDAGLRGEDLTETYTGTLGPSVRAVVPIRADGRVLGLVSVGIKRSAIDRSLQGQLPLLALAGGLALLVAAGGTGLVTRRLRRQTHDLGPRELSRMYAYYDAVLHAVHEGLLLLDDKGRVQLVNDEARRLLGLPADVVGLPVADLPLGASLSKGEDQTDELHLTGDRVLVVNQRRAAGGSVVTLRDHTDLQALTGELDSVRGFAESLRSAAHEAANRLHTVVSLIGLGRVTDALEFATGELALSQQLADRVVEAVEEPVLVALLLGKVAQASERGVELVLDPEAAVPPGVADPRDLVTIVGNLIDNAVDAAVAAPPPRRVEVAAWVVGEELVLEVADSGTGLDAEQVEQAFARGWSTKTDERLIGRGLGLALVGQAVHRHGGTIDVTGDAGAVFTVRLPTRARVTTS
ncbi:sensor histidine kinase [Cryptosporangium arvum]|uniref:histidine kinase n=1 Tax=Cryptosporangium arvum DSM 44712 TaxID=927661 RepID=A0A011AHL4_9ACTN|nr:sensor histidine kinase [Cryptosporangium arvum]EXG81511.1 signal transduction histidine kinase regulating citrate/malate metabolism [Cryptosporangium arvum DSM 44712]